MGEPEKKEVRERVIEKRTGQDTKLTRKKKRSEGRKRQYYTREDQSEEI
jgi:hypothetical protein